MVNYIERGFRESEEPNKSGSAGKPKKGDAQPKSNSSALSDQIKQVASKMDHLSSEGTSSQSKPISQGRAVVGSPQMQHYQKQLKLCQNELKKWKKKTEGYKQIIESNSRLRENYISDHGKDSWRGTPWTREKNGIEFNIQDNERLTREAQQHIEDAEYGIAMFQGKIDDLLYGP